MPFLAGLDKAIFSAVNRFSGSWLDLPLFWVSLSADFTVLMLVGLLIIYHFGGPARFQKAFAFCLTLLLLDLSVEWLKLFVARPRPFVEFGSQILHGMMEGKNPAPLSHSFPSGHAASSLGAAVFLNGIFSRRLWFLYVWAFAVCLSRVYFGFHYPTDVLAGALFGILFAAIGLRLYHRWEAPAA